MITKIRKSMAVKRFHTEERVREETVGHHTANLCMILLRLDPHCSRDLLVLALMHDLPEGQTGDIPATAKWRWPDIKESVSVAERDVYKDMNLMPPLVHQAELEMLKLADMTDLVMSSYEDYNRGNIYAMNVVSNGIEYILNMQAPQWAKDKALKLIDEVKHVSK